MGEVCKFEIREALSRSDRKVWIRFAETHYSNHPFYVPQLFVDEVAYFDPKKNPIFDVAQVRLFLALVEGTVVGRICGIINPLEEEKLGRKVVRFGWFESIDDQDVADLLLETVEEWARKEGCVEITGPLGFSDLDPGGILVEGFGQIPTISGSYQYPYYASLLEHYGLEKDVDYVEYRADITEGVPFLERLRGKVAGAGPYTVRGCKSRKELMTEVDDIWHILETAFEPLRGVVPLTEAQTRFYTKKYLSYLDPDFVKYADDASGKMVAFFIAIPNLSHSFRKARGRLFPFGWFHILREYRKPQTIDFLLAGALPEVPTVILSAVGLIKMYDTLRVRGVRYIETNRELETNTAVNRIWRRFNIVSSRRTRVYRMSLEGRG
jgi:hypothetical protein